jgi:division protein CdvB (Snf7/Vps24/ESCRT-III family)
MAARSLAMKEIEDVFEDLDSLLKNPEVGAELIASGVNTSLAIVAAEALKAYLSGDKARAAEDFEMVAEEISSRLMASRKDAS